MHGSHVLKLIYLCSSMPHAHEDPGRQRRCEIHQSGQVATGHLQFQAVNRSKGEGQACDFRWGWQGGSFTSLHFFLRMTTLTDNRSMASSSLWWSNTLVSQLRQRKLHSADGIAALVSEERCTTTRSSTAPSLGSSSSQSLTKIISNSSWVIYGHISHIALNPVGCTGSSNQTRTNQIPVSHHAL